MDLSGIVMVPAVAVVAPILAAQPSRVVKIPIVVFEIGLGTARSGAAPSLGHGAVSGAVAEAAGHANDTEVPVKADGPVQASAPLSGPSWS